jgi:putative effector of murein hydrolase
VIYYAGHYFVSGEGWGLLIALWIGFLVALGLAFVLHGFLALRLRLGWIHALVVVPLGVAPMLLTLTGQWPDANQWAWTIVTALAAPAVVALLTAGQVRRAR